jgi:hypothetical protein
VSGPLPSASERDPAPDPDDVAELEDFCRPPQFCRYCGHVGLVPHWRSKFVAKPLGTWSLAGAQLKANGWLIAWPWVSCPGCGHNSEMKN